jgi:hypothetical protein
MSNTSPKTDTLIVCSTATLSGIADEIVKRAGAGTLSKSAVLNVLAAGIAGPKHNWGFLTGSEGPVVAKGLEISRDDAGALLTIATTAKSRSCKTQSSCPSVPVAGITQNQNDGSMEMSLVPFVGVSGKPTGREIKARVSAVEILKLRDVMRDEAGAFSLRNWEGKEISFEASNGKLFAILQHRGLTVKNWVEEGSLISALHHLHAPARAAVLESPAGKVAQRSFQLISESDMMIEEELKAHLIDRDQIAAAVNEAALIFLKTVDSSPGFKERLEANGAQSEITDRIFDHDWTILTDLLGLPEDPE